MGIARREADVVEQRERLRRMQEQSLGGGGSGGAVGGAIQFEQRLRLFHWNVGELNRLITQSAATFSHKPLGTLFYLNVDNELVFILFLPQTTFFAISE